jgi:plasmid maintenance system antidote protein VapI
LRGGQAMALRLGKLCGNGPEFWLRLQMLRDLWRLERTLAADLARIPTQCAARPDRVFSPAQLKNQFS